MRNVLILGGAVLSLAGCMGSSLDRDRPDEFAVARQAPLVIPPDFGLAPPNPGALPGRSGAETCPVHGPTSARRAVAGVHPLVLAGPR